MGNPEKPTSRPVGREEMTELVKNLGLAIHFGPNNKNNEKIDDQIQDLTGLISNKYDSLSDAKLQFLKESLEKLESAAWKDGDTTNYSHELIGIERIIEPEPKDAKRVREYAKYNLDELKKAAENV